MNGVPSCNFTLLDRNMDDFMESVDVTHSVDVGLVGPHRIVD